MGTRARRSIIDRPVEDVLMLNNEADPATSYPGALDTRLSTPGTVRMVSVDNGLGHVVGLGASTWAQTAMLSYLRDGIFPRRDLYCQGEPLYISGAEGVAEDAVWTWPASVPDGFTHSRDVVPPVASPHDPGVSGDPADVTGSRRDVRR